MAIEYPIEIDDIVLKSVSVVKEGMIYNSGDLVAIRPCGEEYKNQTYLGVYLGDIARGVGVSYDKDSKDKDGNTKKVLIVGLSGHNPAIFVPDLGKIVFGCESWWTRIKDETHLKKITDEDIDNQWYVKLFKKMMEDERQD
jgi:hypothetical protein